MRRGPTTWVFLYIKLFYDIVRQAHDTHERRYQIVYCRYVSKSSCSYSNDQNSLRFVAKLVLFNLKGTASLEPEGGYWATVGYNAVLQDFRGRYNSSGKIAIKQEMTLGTFNFWSTAASDAYDTMEWLTAQSWSNGQVTLKKTTFLRIFRYLLPESAQMESRSTCNLCSPLHGSK
jgi:hypothetical protein